MSNHQTDKEERKERFQRRRGRASLENDNSIPRRRREPYKRQNVEYDPYDDEEDFEFDSD